jgi:hypothetical protein
LCNDTNESSATDMDGSLRPLVSQM